MTGIFSVLTVTFLVPVEIELVTGFGLPPSPHTQPPLGISEKLKCLPLVSRGMHFEFLLTLMRPLPFNHSGNRKIFLMKQTFGIPASI